MGNFHCVPSGCAEVVYREYLSPVVRWRYPGEDWQEKIADDYSVENVYRTCPGIPYRLFYSTAVILNGTLVGWNSNSSSLPPIAPYTNIRLTSPSISVGTQYFYGTPIFHWAFNNQGINPTGSRTRIYQIILDSANQSNIVVFTSTSSGLRLDDIRPDGTQYSCPPNCVFTVTKNGVIVHQQTRAVCPEVEKLPCRLSEQVKTIEIEKLPYLERVEVRNQSIETLYLPPANLPILDVKSLPNECLNIYNTYILAAPFLSDYVALPGIINPYQYIAQICSAPGCLPPQYQVICDCECQSCPDGTHSLICDDIVCCYGDNGKVVLEIPKSDYCGGESCCG